MYDNEMITKVVVMITIQPPGLRDDIRACLHFLIEHPVAKVLTGQDLLGVLDTSASPGPGKSAIS